MANSDLLQCSSSSSTSSSSSSSSSSTTTKSGQTINKKIHSKEVQAQKAINSSSGAIQQQSSGSISINRSRQRWQLLSKAVRLKRFDLQDLMKSYEESISSSTPSSSSSNDDSSMDSLIQRDPLSVIETYGLINYHYENNDNIWIKCHLNPKLLQNHHHHHNPNINLFIKLVQNRLHLKDLVGFDNSGNVRVWSSEEALGYLIANNEFLKTKLQGKIICELGAGMTGLAGLICAKLDLHQELYLTDGNIRCVQNIEEIVFRNFPTNKKSTTITNGQNNHSDDYLNGFSSSNDNNNDNHFNTSDNNIHVQKLCWNQFGDYQNLKNHIETILCADCLFCSDQHQNLIDTIDFLLVQNNNSHNYLDHNNMMNDHSNDLINAQAIIMAPRRGNKLDRFIQKVFDDGRFLLQVFEQYDENFSELFNKLRKMDPNRYDPDTCYPYLLVMKRRIPSSSTIKF